MERFWCCLAGFVIALVLVAGFLIVKSVVEEYVERVAKNVCNKQFEGISHYVRDLTVDLIDRKLAEKERERETN